MTVFPNMQIETSGGRDTCVKFTAKTKSIFLSQAFQRSNVDLHNAQNWVSFPQMHLHEQTINAYRYLTCHKSPMVASSTCWWNSGAGNSSFNLFRKPSLAALWTNQIAVALDSNIRGWSFSNNASDNSFWGTACSLIWILLAKTTGLSCWKRADLVASHWNIQVCLFDTSTLCLSAREWQGESLCAIRTKSLHLWRMQMWKYKCAVPGFFNIFIGRWEQFSALLFWAMKKQLKVMSCHWHLTRTQ